MMTSERSTLAGLTAASLAALTLAHFVQYGLGYPPCALCLQARLPHWAVLLIGPLGLYLGRPRLALWLVLAALVAAFAISLAHVGVEAGWLPLPGGCAVSPFEPTTQGDLRTALLARTQPSCDQPGPAWLGVSMASWHAAAALLLAALAAVTLSRAGARR